MTWETYQMLPITHWLVRVQGIGEDMLSNVFSFINFELLEFYWTYFLALQTTTPKIPPMRLISLDHEPKMRCCAMSSNYEPWWDYIALSFGPWASASFLWIRTLLGFKINSPKIHDNVDVVPVMWSILSPLFREKYKSKRNEAMWSILSPLFSINLSSTSTIPLPS